MNWLLDSARCYHQNLIAIIPASVIALLSAATDDMKQAWEREDLVANVETDVPFHTLIARNCINRLLRARSKELQDLISETQRQPIPMTPPTGMRSSILEHRAIVAAFKKGRASAARKTVETHIRNTVACVGIALTRPGLLVNFPHRGFGASLRPGVSHQ